MQGRYHPSDAKGDRSERRDGKTAKMSKSASRSRSRISLDQGYRGCFARVVVWGLFTFQRASR